MTRGSRGRRTAGGIALNLAFLAAGCRHGLPVRKVDPALDPRPVRQGTTAGPKDVADEGVPLPPLPLQPITDREALQAAAPAPTPMLDEALVRTEAVQDAIAGSLIEPERSLVPEPTAVKLAEPETQTPETTPRTAAPGAEPAPAPPPAPLQEPPPDPPPPVPLTWQEGVEQLRSIARDRASGTAPGARAWALRERLLAGLAENPESIEGVEVPLFQAIAVALAAATPEDATSLTAPDLRAAAMALEAEAPLEIMDLRLCSKVLGFGSYQAIEAQSLHPGQTILVYCELAGLRYEPHDGQFRSRLESRVEIVPEAGGSPVWQQSLGSADDLCRRRRRDYYVNYRLALPSSLPAGSYKFRLIQKDLLSGRETAKSATITVR